MSRKNNLYREYGLDHAFSDLELSLGLDEKPSALPLDAHQAVLDKRKRLEAVQEGFRNAPENEILEFYNKLKEAHSEYLVAVRNAQLAEPEKKKPRTAS